MSERTRWVIRGERVVDQNRHIRLSTADVELPDGTEFTQYVIQRYNGVTPPPPESRSWPSFPAADLDSAATTRT